MSTTGYSTPQKQKPNPHPYAIKTTSTALLSRNSSSSSVAPSTHHYIPPSPSPTQTGFGGERNYTRHHYSTSESPRPLPAPPSAAALRGGFKDDEDDTPRRELVYSLPQQIKLPEDPKQWTPAEVSIYLTSSLNSAGHDLPTHDIATSVKDKKITGKSFLRLNEGDLEEYGINQLWRTTLLDASGELRRNVLRGRIWGNSAEHDDEYDDDNNLSSNSNFVITNRQRSLSTTSETRGRVRDMIDTLERSSSASSSELDEEGSCTNGRRTKSKQDKVHHRHHHHHHHRHRSLEQHQQELQLQQQGRLPQRGSVSTLFGTSGPDTPEQEIEDKDSTITAHARRNVNGKEPRLLPFPPTGPRPANSIANYAHIVTPSHTGTSHPLPPSPLDHARTLQTTPYPNQVLNAQPIHHHHQPFLFPTHSQHNPTPNTLNYYELGFKNSLPLSPPPPIGPSIRSPNSQRYVVQHNNVQSSISSSSTPGGHSAGKGRLLPYPPIVGEAELFHPRPRMGMGVGGLAGGLEDGLNGDETVYHSALETQTESADSETGGGEEGSATSFEETPEYEAGVASNVTYGVEPPIEGREERSIQDAQLQPQPRIISGVGAWDAELDETVKRTSGNSAAAATPSGSTMSAGGTKTRTRPRKRDLMIRRTSGKKSEVDDLSEGGSTKEMTTGVLDLESFEAPAAENDIDDDKGLKTSIPLLDSTASASTAASLSASISRESVLDERESSIAERESSIAERESTIIALESSLNVRESSIAERESLITKRESSITSRESTISEHESTLTARESILSTDKSEIHRRMGDIQQREVEMEKRESEVGKREQEASEREMKVKRREEEVNEWYQGKLAEIERVLVNVPPPIPASTVPFSPAPSWTRIAKSEWLPSPMEFASQLCTTFLLPVLGEQRTPAFLLPGNRVASSSNSSTTTSVSTTTLPPTTTTTKTPFARSKWPPSPTEFARRLCATFLLPLLGEERTPTFLLPSTGVDSSSKSSAGTSVSTTTPPPKTPLWTVKRDFSLNRLLRATVGGGSYIVFMSIGICLILLRGVVRRVLRVGGYWRR